MRRTSDRLLLQLMKETQTPGIAVATVRDGKLTQQMTLGHTDASATTPVTAETVFGAASLSKLAFTYLVLKLVQDRKFNLDKPLYTILEDKRLRGSQARKRLTARLVLSHQTGLPISAAESWQTLEFQFEPGKGYGYSGVAFSYLQKVIEAHTSMTLEALAKKYIFDPLKMTNSSFYPPNVEPKVARAENSLHTTASDFACFVAAWLNDQALQYAFESAVSLTEDPWALGQGLSVVDLQKIDWGLGWGLQKTGQGKVTRAFHSGDMNQWRGWVAINLEDKSAIVYFANSANGHMLADKIISPVVDLEYGLKYLFEKYGFARKLEPEWKAKEIKRITAIIKKYEPLLWEEIQKNQPKEAKAESDRYTRRLRFFKPAEPADEFEGQAEKLTASKKREREEKPHEAIAPSTGEHGVNKSKRV